MNFLQESPATRPSTSTGSSSLTGSVSAARCSSARTRTSSTATPTRLSSSSARDACPIQNDDLIISEVDTDIAL